VNQWVLLAALTLTVAVLAGSFGLGMSYERARMDASAGHAALDAIAEHDKQIAPILERLRYGIQQVADRPLPPPPVIRVHAPACVPATTSGTADTPADGSRATLDPNIWRRLVLDARDDDRDAETHNALIDILTTK
jgi:hypothetical protein